MTPVHSDDPITIHIYTRAQALADGFQVDVSGMAKDAGFTFPTFITRAVYERYVAVTPGVEGQDEMGRLWDILNMLRFAFLQGANPANRIPFAVYVRNDNVGPKPVVLTAICGPLDFNDPKPAITIMMPEED
jgi:hypothetical protein